VSADAAASDDVPTASDGNSGVTRATAVDLEQDLLAQIESACQQFKVALWAGQRPRIEDAWSDHSGPSPPILLRDLLTLELAHRRDAGERPEPAEYQARFPGQDAVIRAAFEAVTQVSADATRRAGAPATDVGSVTRPGVRPRAGADMLAMADLEILGELGGGGQAVVYRAYDRRRGQVVALKVLPRTSPSALYRFKQEFRTLAGMSHPNLVSLYELFSDGQEWSFTMELIAGVDLLTALRAEADPALVRLRDAFRQLAQGVAALHDGGHVHRDLKPSNVLMTRAGRVVILDMGIAAELDRAGLHHSTEPQVIGTVPYMSPEQAAGLPVSSASDWYSVGIMLYEALAGERPFRGGTLAILLDKQNIDPPAPGALVPGIPDDLNALCVELLCRDPAARPSDRDVLRRLGGEAAGGPAQRATPGYGQAPRVPLIGREEQIAALAAGLAAVKQGRTVICAVHGRSGVGKSALIERFLDDCAAGAGVDTAAAPVVLAGRCYEQESVPYKAFDSLVDALCRYLRRLPRWEAEALLPRDVQLLGRVFPVLRRVAAVGEAPHRGLEIPDQQELRQRAFWALRELLARLGDRKPLILAIDDLQWADVDSAALLSDLLRPPDPPTLLLLACYRSEETASNPFLLALSSTSSALDRRELAIEPLSSAQAGDLARTLLERGGEDPVVAAAADVDAIARESGGNPFYVAELVAFAQSGARTELSAAASSSAIALDQVLWARVVGLPEPARRLLEVIAVSGRPLTQTAACRAVALGQDERAALAVLRSGRLIRSAGTSGATSGGEREVIETYHDRVRETLVAHLAPEARANCHERLALALLDSGETDPETLAVHFQGANQPERAAAYFARGADQAAETLAFDRAAKLYRLALEMEPGQDQENRRRLRTKLGDALAGAGRGAEAAREYLAARPGAAVTEALELERRAAMQFLISGHVDEGITVLRSVLRAVGMTLPGSPRSALRSLILSRLRLRLRPGGIGFREHPADAVSSEELSRIDICWAAVAGLSMVAPLPAAVFQTRNLLLSLQAGEPYRVARALAMQAFHTASAGGPSRRRTLRFLQAADTLATRVGHPHALGMVALASGVAAYCCGRWKEAHAACERATEIFRSRCTGVAWELTTARLISLPSLVWMGDHPEAFRRLHLHRQEAQERGELYGLATIGAFGVHERLEADEPEAARAELAEAMRVWSRQGYYMQHMEELWMESHIDLYREDGNAAWDRMTRQWPDLQRSLLMRVQLIRLGMRLLRARCALAKAVAVGIGTGEAQALLDAALRDALRVERESMPWANALVKLIHAAVAAARGDRARATATLEAAVANLESCDMRNLAAVARRRHGELIGGDLGRALIDQGNFRMTAQKIQNLDRYTAMLAPGFRG
jgi:tetratricopeptide (TPR) repeat protein